MGKRFEIWLFCESNDLRAMIQVISVNRKTAGDFAKRKFFPGKGWAITSVREIS